MFPFPSAPTPPSKRPRTTSGLDPEDRGRLILLGAGLLFCLAIGAGLYAYVRTTSAKPAAPAAPGGKPADGPVMDITPVPLFPEEEAGEIQKILVEKVSALPAIVQGVAAVDPEPYEFLVDQATLNARILNLQPEGFDRDPDLSRILADPGAHVGRFLSVSGELLSLEKLPYEGKGRQVLEARRGTVRDAKGRLFSFTWPVGNTLEPDAVQPGKGWVRVRGLFYKTWPVPDPAGGAAPVLTPHLVLQGAPEVDYPPVVVKDIDPSWMGDVHDAEAGEMLKRDDAPVYYLLNLVKNLGETGFEGWLKAKETASPGLKNWPPEDFTGRFKELLDRPDAHRFQPVRYSGFLVRPTVTPVAPNPGNLDRVWLGYLVDMDFVPAVWVLSPRSFVDHGFKDEDRIRVDGIFFKRIAFQPQGGGPLSQAAVIVAGKMVVVPMGQEFGSGLLAGVLGLLVLVAAGLFYFIFSSRKDDRVAEERRQARLARKRKAPEA